MSPCEVNIMKSNNFLQAVLYTIIAFILTVVLLNAALGDVSGSSGKSGVVWVGYFIAIFTFFGTFHCASDGSKKATYTTTALIWLFIAGPFPTWFIYDLWKGVGAGEVPKYDATIGTIIWAGSFGWCGFILLAQVWGFFQFTRIGKALLDFLGKIGR